MNKAAAALSVLALAVVFVTVRQVFRLTNRKTTVEEMVASLPIELRQPEPTRIDAQQRYGKLLTLAAAVNPVDVDRFTWFPKDEKTRKRQASIADKYRPLLGRIEAFSKSGPLEIPAGKYPLPKRRSLLELELAMGLTASSAVVRRDAGQASRMAHLLLEMGRSLRRSGGYLSDQTTARVFEWDGLVVMQWAEWYHLLTDKERQSFLREVPPDSGSNPNLAEAFGRSLRKVTIPSLAILAAHPERMPSGAGAFDPLDTVHLFSALYLQARSDSLSAEDWAWENTASMIAETAKELAAAAVRRGAKPRPSLTSLLRDLGGGARRNEYGMGLVAKSNAVSYIQLSRQLAAYHNVVRAMLLLRHGGTANLRDPLGHGNLQIDPRRRIIWSVGMNGMDDHGRYGKPGTYAGDLVSRY